MQPCSARLPQLTVLAAAAVEGGKRRTAVALRLALYARTHACQSAAAAARMLPAAGRDRLTSVGGLKLGASLAPCSVPPQESDGTTFSETQPA